MRCLRTGVWRKTISIRGNSAAALLALLVGIAGSPAWAQNGQDSEPNAGPPVVAEAPAEVATQETSISTTLETNLDAASAPAPDDAAKKKAALKKAVSGAYAPVFYNNKFDYLCNPLYDDCHFGEQFKRICLDDCWTLDVGGQYRARYHSEHGHRGLGLTGLDDDFLLHRLRLYANAQYGERLRIYAEFLDADSNYENLPPRGIEVNRADITNLFADIWLWEDCCTGGTLTARIGRQEMIEGAQRLVSPLDFANTRRTFEGVNTLWKGENWNAETFYVRPVLVDSIHFDNPTYRREFFGTYATYKAIKDQMIDVYALQYNNASAPNSYQFTTLGSRWQGSCEEMLWELEGATQFGKNTDDTNHAAGMFTAGLGHKWADHCWKPTLWAYWDWGSGGNVLGAGQGFNQLFPLGHKYLGFMDLFGRSNIQDVNVQLAMQPREKWNLLLWYHYFRLDTAADTPYNVDGSPFKKTLAPASVDLGHELDFTATYSINARMDVLLGYSHFFAGDYYKLTPGLTYRGDADFYYVQYQWNF